MVGGVGKEGEEKHQVLVEIFGGRAQGRHQMVENGQIGHFPSLDFNFGMGSPLSYIC